jgi:sugar/nucleoside kinase (ribokinase family)
LFASVDDASEILPRVRQYLAADSLLVLRHGAGGCRLAGAHLPSPFVHAAAPVVAAIDTTGAGDTHTGVLIASLADGADLLSAALRANAAAALSVTQHGPATAPHRRELDDFLSTIDARCERRETKTV